VPREIREVLADYPHHGRGWVKQDQWVFYTNQDGDTMSPCGVLAKRPADVDIIIAAFRMARRPQLRWRFDPQPHLPGTRCSLELPDC